MYCSKTKIKEKTVFILAAAGKGKRMGLDYPKQFLKINEEPLFYYSLKTAFRNKKIDEIIIVTNKENINYIKDYCKEKKFDTKVKKIIAGGEERQNSVYNAIKEINEAKYVIIQDAARPFLKEKYIEESLKILENGYDACVIGVKCKDTIKKINSSNEIVETPKRDELVAIHTPQTFKFELIKFAHEKAVEENFYSTDDSALVERIGKKVKFIQGDYDNIKITTVEDLKYLENLNWEEK